MSAKILVVDDEPDLELLVNQKFRHRIRSGELLFTFARDGVEALDKLSNDPEIAVIVTDIRMPRMDGLTLLAKLKELSRLLRAVVVSAYGDMQNIRTAMNLGAYDFVTKPIDFVDLETTIDKTIGDIKTIREVERKRQDAERAQFTLARYMSPNLAKHLSEHPEQLELGGERRELSFVCTDMAEYTPFIENSDPAVAVSVMNEYISGMCSIVLKHEGTIDIVVGDAVIAMFGAPVTQSDHASRAANCALELDAFAEDFSNRQNAEGMPIGLTRIGVHTGKALVGNVGGDMYFHYTAQGDAIVTATRLEKANKYLGTRICVSEATARQIPDFSGRPVGTLLLKGKHVGIKAFEPAADFPTDHNRAYMAAYQMLEDNDPNAIKAFAALVGGTAEDRLAKYHLQRLLAGEQGSIIDLGK